MPAPSRISRRSPRPGRAACSTSGTSRSGRRPGPASTSSAAATIRCSTSARARDLRARLRSYFRSDRQRPAVEAALAAAERIEWRVTRLGARGGARGAPPDPRAAPAGQRARVAAGAPRLAAGSAATRSSRPTRPSPVGPLRSRRTAQLAARALTPDELARPARRCRGCGAGCASWRTRGGSRTPAGCATASPRSSASAASSSGSTACANLECCVLVPAGEPGYVRAHFVAGGRVAAERTLPPGGGAALEVEAGLAASRRRERL